MSEEIYAKLNLDAEDAGRSINDINKELRETNEALKEVAINGKNFDKLTKHVEKLKEELNGVKKTSKQTSIGIKDISNTVSGGFAVATGAMALLGTKSEKLAEVQKKVQAAIALAVGVRNLQESKLNLTLIKRGVITAKNKVITLAMAGAQKVLVGTTKLLGIAANTSSKGFKALKVAIASTGIGLIVVALGTMAAYWDDIVSFMGFGTSEAEKQLELTTAKKDAALEELSSIEGSTNQMKLQGLSQREILDLKIKAVDAAIQASEVEMAAQKAKIEADIASAKRNKDLLTGLLLMITAPVDALIYAYNLLPGVDDIAYASESIAGMFFDPADVAAEGQEALKEQEKALKQLREKKAGLQLSVQQMDKANSNKTKEQRKKEAEELRKLEEEIALQELELDEERAILKLEQQLAYELEALEGKENAKEQELLITQKYNKLIQDAEKELAEKRKEIAEKTATQVAEFLNDSLSEYDSAFQEIKDLQRETNDAILENNGQTLRQKQKQELEDFDLAHLRRKADLNKKIKLLQEEIEVTEDNEELQKALQILRFERADLDIENNNLRNLIIKRQNQELNQDTQDVVQASIDASMQMIDAITANIDASISKNTAAMEAEIEATGATGAAKEAIEEKYAAKDRKLQARKKAISAAQAIINTYVGATKAMSDLPPPASFIAAGATIAAGLANVRQIYAQDVGGGKGGSTPAGSTPTPRGANQVFSLAGAQEDQAIRAYVVTDEVTNSQDQLANIRRRSAI